MDIKWIYYYSNMQSQSFNLTGSPSQIREEVRRRLEFHNIFREVTLLPHMTPKLTVELKWFRNIDLLAKKTDEELHEVLKNITFLSIQRTGEAATGSTLVTFDYKLSATLLIITGVHDDTLSKLLHSFNQFHKKQTNNQGAKDSLARKVAHNGFFTLIEAATQQNLVNLKGFLRTKKKHMDERPSSSFKVENRRIRIFSVGEEDTFNFIIDVMAEYKAEKFIKSMGADLQHDGRRASLTQTIQYKAFTAFRPAIHHQKIEKRPERSNQKQQADSQVEAKKRKQQKNKEEDESSDSTCFTSQFADKFQDIGEEGTFKGNLEIFSSECLQEGKGE